MRKRRLIYLVFSLLALVVLTTLSIMYDYTFFFVLLMLIIIIPNYMLKNNERRITNDIIMGYGQTCDPYAYIDKMKDYSKKCFLSKRQKMVYDLYYSVAYIDAGNFDDAKEILLNIDEKCDCLDEVSKVLYLKAWCDYFFFNGFDEKLRITLLKLKDLITNSRLNNLKASYSLIYMVLEAKYYILTGENLLRAKEIYNSRKGTFPTTLSLIGANYQMALIDLKEKNYNQAIEKLKIVASKNDSLFIVRNSKKILDDITKLA